MNVRARCPLDGDVFVDYRTIAVRWCIDSGKYSYTFPCPECRKATTHSCSPRIARILLEAGCVLVRWYLPQEMFELHDGPPICADDVIEFHNADLDDAWNELVGGS